MSSQGNITDVLLSGSTDGRPIKVATTATPGTTIHTAAAGTATRDHIWLYAINTHTADLALTLEWGGTTAPDDTIGPINVPANGGAMLIAENFPLQNGLVVKAFCGTANKVIIVGRVARYTP